MRRRNRRLFAKHILSDITEVKAFIHRIKFFSNFKYEDLHTIYEGKMYLLEKDNNNSSMGAYDKRYRLNLSSGTQCTLDMYPDEGYKPLTMLSLANPTAYVIRELFDDAKNIASHVEKKRAGNFEWKISSIEYTFDFMCKNSIMVGDLYYTLRRYAYFPYCKSTRMSGGKFCGYSETGEYHEEREGSNSVTHYLYTKNEKSRFKKLAKIYERGEDRNKRGQEWQYDKCDRVRCEVTVRSEFLRNKEIDFLLDLLNNNRFAELFFPLPKRPAFMQFKQFFERNYRVTKKQRISYTGGWRRRYTPPADIENFRADEGKNGDPKYVESFQEEQFKCTSEGYRNVAEQSSHFDGVRYLMKEAIRGFDLEWLKALSGK